jgi:hypothetical protein
MIGAYVRYGKFYHKGKMCGLSAIPGSSSDSASYSYPSNHKNRLERNHGLQNFYKVTGVLRLGGCLWLTEISEVIFNRSICCLPKCNSNVVQLE